MKREKLELGIRQNDVRQDKCPVCGFTGLDGTVSVASHPTKIIRTRTCPQCDSRIEFEFSLTRCSCDVPRRCARSHILPATIQVGRFEGQTFEIEHTFRHNVRRLADSFPVLPERLSVEATDRTSDPEWQLVSNFLATQTPTTDVDGKTCRLTGWNGPVRLKVDDKGAWLDYVLDRNANDTGFLLRDIPNVMPEEVELALDESVVRLETRGDKVVCVIHEPKSDEEVGWFRFDECQDGEYSPKEYLEAFGAKKTAERIAWKLHEMHYGSVETNKSWHPLQDIMKRHKTYAFVDGRTVTTYR